jgi:FKBP-type peptidyl-prolyl cis-trans isomerase
MARGRAQRIGIWVIAIVLTVGTLAGFLALILSPKNQASDQARLADLQAQYQKASDEYQTKVAAQSAALSFEHFGTLNQFSSRVATFDAAAVTELKTEDLVAGTGGEIGADTTFAAYYIGWNPAGEIFDQSIDGTSLKAPFTVTPGSVIKGWSEGVIGMKVGGIRELTIPSEKAYGETGSGDKIPANTPLKFILLIIPTPEAIPQAEVPTALLRYYQRGSF